MIRLFCKLKGLLFATTAVSAISGLVLFTPLCFASPDRESVVNWQNEVEITNSYNLPFTEDWTTGLFETNEWTVTGANWQIAGQSGNPVPCAQFNYTPVGSEYEQALESPYINGVGIVDGKIKFDFHLKHALLDSSETEMLTVQVNSGTGWIQVYQFTNSEAFDWTPQRFDITNIAKGNVFKVRFLATGENTTNILNWQIDNIHIYRSCPAPTNLNVSIPDPNNHGDQFLLEWTDAAGLPDKWIYWDNGTNDDAIGLTGGGTFNVAARFTSQQLAPYTDKSLTKLRLFPYQAGGSIVLKVWTGANAGNLVLQQPVAEYNPGVWNEFILNTPVAISGLTELWIGYTIIHPDYVYIAGCDAGPAVAGYGDMISEDGSVWQSMAIAYGLNYNWNLQGWVETFDGVYVPLVPQADLSTYGSTGNVVAGNLPQLPGATVAADANKRPAELVGYNVYRSIDDVSDSLIATTTETFYLDTDANISIPYASWCYTVTALYEDCESVHAGPMCDIILNSQGNIRGSVNIYPNPSSTLTNIDLSSEIVQMIVYNFSGRVVHEQIIAEEKTIQLNVHNYDAGAYLIRFITRSGESFAKKITVAR